jgi:RpiR family transcriptional regulator, carbohydrate utilization regulator
VAEPNTENSSRTSVLAAVLALLPSLAPSDAKVALYLIESPHHVIFQSVSEVGLAAGTASSTVVRCAQQLGSRGFQDLKISLARELGPGAGRVDDPAPPEAAPGSLLDHVLERFAEALRSASRTVDPGQFASVVNAIYTAGRVLLAGIGTSAPVAQDAAFRLRVIGNPPDAPVEIYAQQM